MICTAHRTNGDPCRAWAIRGATVCRVHGGSIPAVRAKAARTLAEAAATRTIRGMPIQPLGNPITALTEVVAEVLTFKTYLAGRVDELSSLSAFDEKGSEQVRAILGAYERGLDRSATWLTAIARLNLDDRLVRVTEATQAMVLRAIDAALTDAGVAGEARTKAARVAAGHLRLVGAA